LTRDCLGKTSDQHKEKGKGKEGTNKDLDIGFRGVQLDKGDQFLLMDLVLLFEEEVNHLGSGCSNAKPVSVSKREKKERRMTNLDLDSTPKQSSSTEQTTRAAPSDAHRHSRVGGCSRREKRRLERVLRCSCRREGLGDGGLRGPRKPEQRRRTSAKTYRGRGRKERRTGTPLTCEILSLMTASKAGAAFFAAALNLNPAARSKFMKTEMKKAERMR
jgi:hypothetical protein